MINRFFLVFGFVLFSEIKAQTTAVNYTWYPFTASGNILGSICGNSKPLQYNSELNLITFIHQKSPTYSSSPIASSATQSNVMVAMVSQNLGATWDSTCLWNSNTCNAVIPQAVIYNPWTNSNINNAQIVASGTTYSNTMLTGSWLSNKQLGNGNYTNSSNNANQQLMPNTAPYGSIGKTDRLQYGMACTNDGVVHALGIIADSVNQTNTAFRGARLAKGMYNNGTFSWTGDSILPPFIKNSVTNQVMASQTPYMAWNENGTVGYVWFIGCRQGATGSNKGYQPIVYKTINSGTTWSLMPAINFTTQPFLQGVISKLVPVSNSTLIIPKFNEREGIDGTVDMFDNLHIIACLNSTSKSHTDSLNYEHRFLNFDGQSYLYQHTPGKRPYIYDFTLGTLGWKVTIIDSLSSEAPGSKSDEPGYADNPWDTIAPGEKVTNGARLQMSRTTDGRYLVYAWSQSDTNFTNYAYKWNSIPNVSSRFLDLCNNYSSIKKTNVNWYTNGNAAFINARAGIFFISPKFIFKSYSYYSSPYNLGVSYVINLPITISTNPNTPLSTLKTNTHYFANAALTYSFYLGGYKLVDCTNGIDEAEGVNQKAIKVYPNPATTKLTLELEKTSQPDGVFRIVLTTVLGQAVRDEMTEIKEQKAELNLNGITAGIYLLNITDNNGQIICHTKILKE